MRRVAWIVFGLAASCLAAGGGCAEALDEGSRDAGGGLPEGAGGSPATGPAGSTVAVGSSSTADSAGSTGASGGAGGGVDCSGGLASCDGACADLKSDPKNCGRCGNDCATHPCITGICQALEVLASGQGEARGIAVDATSIYWTSEANGTVMKMPKGGGSATPLASGQSIPSAIAVDATSVYWTNSGDGAVMQVPIGGGSPTPLGTQGGGGIAVDATSVYWTTTADTISRVPIGGGAPLSVCAAPYAQMLAVQGPWVYFSSSGLSDITVSRVPTTGGVPEVLGSSTGPSFVPAIAVDASSVYWADGDRVLQVPLAGGAPPATVDMGFGLWQVTLDATSVYWGTNGGMHVMKAPVDSGSATTVVTTFGDPVTEIAVDASWVYWTSYSAGEIVRAPK